MDGSRSAFCSALAGNLRFWRGFRSLFESCSASRKEVPVEAAVLDRLGQVRGRYVRRLFQRGFDKGCVPSAAVLPSGFHRFAAESPGRDQQAKAY